MRLVLRSIAFDNCLMATMVSIIHGCFAATARPRRSEPALWASAYSCLVIGSIALALRGDIAPFFLAGFAWTAYFSLLRIALALGGLPAELMAAKPSLGIARSRLRTARSPRLDFELPLAERAGSP